MENTLELTQLEKLTQLHPILAALAWSAVTRGIDAQDQQLALTLKESGEWGKLSADHKQWVDMLVGGNLSSEAARQALIDVLIDEMAEL